MTTPAAPAMDDSPTVPRPPGAVEAVLALHDIRWTQDSIVRVNVACSGCDWTYQALTDDACEDAHRAHVAQALVDAGCVLGDDWNVETTVDRGYVNPDTGKVSTSPPFPRALRQQYRRTVTTATRTTPWTLASEDEPWRACTGCDETFASEGEYHQHVTGERG